MKEFSDFCSDEFQQYFYNFTAPKNTSTRYEYVSYVNMLCNYLGKDFLDITSDDALKFLNHMNSRRSDGKLKRKTIVVRLACYNAMAQYIEDKLDGYHNPFSKLQRPEVKSEFDPDKIPTMGELDLLFSEAKKDPKDFLILALAARAGLSASKILQLTTKSIWRDGNSTFLRIESSDGFGDAYDIRLPKDVRDVMDFYISKLDIDLSKREPLFKNKWGNALSIQNVDQLIKRLTSKCDLSEYTLKDFRNRAYLEMAKSGSSIESFMQYTGLESMQTEKFYKYKELVGKDCPSELVNYRLIVPGYDYCKVDKKTMEQIKQVSSEMGISEELLVSRALDNFLTAPF